MKKDLLERLEEYCGADYVPLHMPGAKRNTQEFVMPNPYAIDITEIDGFDNMHHAEDILKEAFERTAKLFGAENARQIAFTSNSTESLNIAIKGILDPGDHVITTVLEHNSVLRPLYEME